MLRASSVVPCAVLVLLTAASASTQTPFLANGAHGFEPWVVAGGGLPVPPLAVGAMSGFAAALVVVGFSAVRRSEPSLRSNRTHTTPRPHGFGEATRVHPARQQRRARRLRRARRAHGAA